MVSIMRYFSEWQRLTTVTERQVSELHVNSSITHEPATPSQLLRSESISEQNPPSIPLAATPTPAAVGEIKEE